MSLPSSYRQAGTTGLNISSLTWKVLLCPLLWNSPHTLVFSFPCESDPFKKPCPLGYRYLPAHHIPSVSPLYNPQPLLQTLPDKAVPNPDTAGNLEDLKLTYRAVPTSIRGILKTRYVESRTASSVAPSLRASFHIFPAPTVVPSPEAASHTSFLRTYSQCFLSPSAPPTRLSSLLFPQPSKSSTQSRSPPELIPSVVIRQLYQSILRRLSRKSI